MAVRFLGNGLDSIYQCPSKAEEEGQLFHYEFGRSVVIGRCGIEGNGIPEFQLFPGTDAER